MVEKRKTNKLEHWHFRLPFWRWPDSRRQAATTSARPASSPAGGVRLYKPWGELRYAWNPTVSDFRYTGQRQTGTGLMDYGARMYDSALGRWTSPDSIIPDPNNPLDYDRYAYARNNPLKYIDSSGHIPIIPIIIGIVYVGSKLIDYGWTAYDVYQSSQVLANPNASDEDRLFAGINIGLAASFEGGEPDDILPAGVPLDDVGRRALMKGLTEAYQSGGGLQLIKYARSSLGNYTDDFFSKLVGKVTDFGKMGKVVSDPGITIGSLSSHATSKHSVTLEMVQSWSTLPKQVLSQNNGQRYLYVTAQGAYVVDAATGTVVTAYSAAEYTTEMQDVARLLGIY